MGACGRRSLVNTHIAPDRGTGSRRAPLDRGQRPGDPAEALDGVRRPGELAGGGDTGSSVEQLATILGGMGSDARPDRRLRLEMADLWGAGYDLRTAEGARGVVDRFERLLGLERLATPYVDDRRSTSAHAPTATSTSASVRWRRGLPSAAA